MKWMLGVERRENAIRQAMINRHDGAGERNDVCRVAYRNRSIPRVATPTARTRLQWPLDLGAAFCNFGSELDVGLPVGTTATHEVEVIVRMPPSSKVVVRISATGVLVQTRPAVIVFPSLVDVGITCDVDARDIVS